MTDPFLQATAAVQYIRSLSPLAPRAGIILGSGLGAFAESVEQPISIPYADIPHFPQSTVQGHSGHLVLGTIGGVPVAVMQGREMPGWLRVATEHLATYDELSWWVEMGIGHARSLPPKKAGQKSAKR